MATTAKVKLVGWTEVDDGKQVSLSFSPDYEDGRNKEWAKYTPALSLSMVVKTEVANANFEKNGAYLLTFEKLEA